MNDAAFRLNERNCMAHTPAGSHELVHPPNLPAKNHLPVFDGMKRDAEGIGRSRLDGEGSQATVRKRRRTGNYADGHRRRGLSRWHSLGCGCFRRGRDPGDFPIYATPGSGDATSRPLRARRTCHRAQRQTRLTPPHSRGAAGVIFTTANRHSRVRQPTQRPTFAP